MSGWRDLVFVDVEASGLHRGSFPVEVGWCGGDLRPSSLVVRPDAGWTLDLWSPAAEAIHGIPRAETLASPHGPRECAEALNAALGGRDVRTDNPEHDAYWLGALFGAAGLAAAFALRPLNDAWVDAMLVSGLGLDAANARIASARAAFPHPHRAGADALAMAASVRAVAEPRWDFRAP